MKESLPKKWLILIVSLIAISCMLLIIVLIQANNSSTATGSSKVKVTQSPYYSRPRATEIVNATTIFSNLEITDITLSRSTYSVDISCKVKNNNPFTVTGYFYVNFYDKSRKLLYNQLISLSAVASGETVTCRTPIPRASFPSDYSYVDFSQASLIRK